MITKLSRSPKGPFEESFRYKLNIKTKNVCVGLHVDFVIYGLIESEQWPERNESLLIKNPNRPRGSMTA